MCKTHCWISLADRGSSTWFRGGFARAESLQTIRESMAPTNFFANKRRSARVS
jgi:hypothetical protein